MMKTRKKPAAWCAAGLAASLLSGVALIGDGASAAPSEGESTFVPINPCRLFDFRPGSDQVGPRSTPLGQNEIHVLQVTGLHGNCDLPASAVGVAMNVTALHSTAPSYLQMWPADAVRPKIGSSLNYVPGQVATPNKVDIKLSADGAIKLYNLNGTIDVLGDVVGYYSDDGLMEMQASLASKANTADVYSKLQVDDLITDLPAFANVYEIDETFNRTEIINQIAAGVVDKADELDLTALETTVTGLEGTVTGKADSVDLDALETTVTGLETTVTGKADTTTVTALAATVAGLGTTVAGKADTITVAALQATVAGLETTVTGKANTTTVTALAATVADKADTTTVTALAATVADKADTTTVTALAATVAGKANAADVYLKSETYSQAEVDTMFGGVVGPGDVYLKSDQEDLFMGRDSELVMRQATSELEVAGGLLPISVAGVTIGATLSGIMELTGPSKISSVLGGDIDYELTAVEVCINSGVGIAALDTITVSARDSLGAITTAVDGVAHDATGCYTLDVDLTADAVAYYLALDAGLIGSNLGITSVDATWSPVVPAP